MPWLADQSTFGPESFPMIGISKKLAPSM